MNDEHAQTVKQLAGVWRLVSSEFRTSSGGVIYPLGEDALGQVIFTESGYMSGQLMRQNRPAFASGDQASGTLEETQAALQGYVAYYGSCEVDVEQKTLTTHVEGSMYPNWVGVSLGSESVLTIGKFPKHSRDHSASGAWSGIAKSSVKTFAILLVSAPIGYTVFNGLLSQRRNIVRTLRLAFLHKFQCVVSCNFLGSGKSA